MREAALIAETKVRFWAGAAANCLAALRRARGACLEAIVNVRRVCEGILMREVWGIVDSLWETTGYVESTFCPSSSRHRGMELATGDANLSPRPIKSPAAPYKWGTPSQSQLPKFMRRSLSNVRARGVRLETLFAVSSRLHLHFHRARIVKNVTHPLRIDKLPENFPSCVIKHGRSPIVAAATSGTRRRRALELLNICNRYIEPERGNITL